MNDEKQKTVKGDRLLTCDSIPLSGLGPDVRELSERAGRGIVLVRFPASNTWLDGRREPDTLSGKWMAATVGEPDYLCGDRSFLDVQTSKSEVADTPEEAVSGLLRQLMYNTPTCPECGGNCSPECGMHPMGCIYGGFSVPYWLITPGCQLEHPVPSPPSPSPADPRPL